MRSQRWPWQRRRLSPHLEIILPPGLLGLKEEARRNVVEILEKPESRSSDSSFTEALRFYTGRVQRDPEPKWSESLCVSTEDRPAPQHVRGPGTCMLCCLKQKKPHHTVMLNAHTPNKGMCSDTRIPLKSTNGDGRSYRNNCDPMCVSQTCRVSLSWTLIRPQHNKMPARRKSAGYVQDMFHGAWKVGCDRMYTSDRDAGNFLWPEQNGLRLQPFYCVN